MMTVKNILIASAIGVCTGISILIFVIFPMLDDYRNNDSDVYAPENLEELSQWSVDKLYQLRKNLKCFSVDYTTIVDAVKDQEKAKAELAELVRVCDIVTKRWYGTYKLEQYQKATEGKKYLHRPKGDK